MPLTKGKKIAIIAVSGVVIFGGLYLYIKKKKASAVPPPPAPDTNITTRTNIPLAQEAVAMLAAHPNTTVTGTGANAVITVKPTGITAANLNTDMANLLTKHHV
jgi:hypothetical protein